MGKIEMVGVRVQEGSSLIGLVVLSGWTSYAEIRSAYVLHGSRLRSNKLTHPHSNENGLRMADTQQDASATAALRSAIIVT